MIYRENPRNLSFTAAKAMSPAELANPKPSFTILDRFRALMRQRAGDLSDEDDDDASPAAEEIVRVYELLLKELTLNSKPIITDLTIVAGEQRDHAAGIAHAVCNRIIEAPAEQKLPALYLLDSIVKNIGQVYVRYFSSRLPQVFFEAYKKVNPSQHSAMRHLFGTWSIVFPPSVLQKIEVQLQNTKPANLQPGSMVPLHASESPQPARGIHVNPKYRRQLDHTVGDNNVQHGREASSCLDIFGQKPSTGYDEYDSDNMEVISSEAAEPQRLTSNGSGVKASFSFGANKKLSSSTSRAARPLSPSSIVLDRSLPPVDEVLVENSPRRLVERAGSSHQAFDHRLGRSVGREEANDWRRKNYARENHQQFETPTVYGLSNGRVHDRTRALITAYGNERGTRMSSGIDNNAALWQNTEEEEFDWEDMSPTLVDRNRVTLPASIPTPGNSRPRLDHGTSSAAPFDGDYRRSNWSIHAVPSRVDGSSVVMPTLSSGFESRSSAYQTNRNHFGSHYRQESWNSLNHLSQSSQYPSNAKGRERASLTDNLPDADGQQRMLPSDASKIGSKLNLMKACGAGMSQRQSNSVFTPEQQFDNFENEALSSVNMPQVGFPRTRRTLSQIASMQQYSLPSWETQQNAVPSSAAPMPSHYAALALNKGFTLQRHGEAARLSLPNSAHSSHPAFPIQNISNIAFSMQGGVLPPLLPGGSSAVSLSMPMSEDAGSILSNQPPGTAFSGLINSLMSQGLISLQKEAPVQDSVITEFNVDLLKVRHDSVISALYGDLPRQCTTCGLRFKCKEEHSSHMDWHVTKNRTSKNRKQKPSRKWFVSTSMWLSGAEALGNDAAPGFFPAETIEEQKNDEDMAVPADEDQKVCALCGEAFDDFFSDETEEWMYKGAVYMNAPYGSAAGMDKSQLGPIVHVKCRSESNVAPPEGFGQCEEGNSDEGGRQTKRMRVN